MPTPAQEGAATASKKYDELFEIARQLFDAAESALTAVEFIEGQGKPHTVTTTGDRLRAALAAGRKAGL